MINININKDWIPFIAVAVLAIMLLGQCSVNSALRDDKKILIEEVENAKSNLRASQDSVELYVNKNGYLEAEISTYAATNKELSENYTGMIKKYQKALGLNKELEGVNALLSAELKSKDSLLISANINPDSTFTFVDSADYGDGNVRVVTLDGKVDSTEVKGNLSIYQTITILAALEKENGINRMRISTKYPFDDINIEGINLIDNELNKYKKKSRWNVNFGIGYGIYPMTNGSLGMNPFVGVMFGYSPKWLQF
jgi:hypothetical protein